MAKKASKKLSVVLFGLPGGLAVELEQVLRGEPRVRVCAHPTVPGPHSLGLLKTLRADVVFCAAEPACCRPLLDAIRQEQMNLPVVVVSRAAEPANWLDAMEAGAQDYCAPPFEPTHVRWILETAVRSRATTGIAG